MSETNELLQLEAPLRLLSFAGIFVLMAALEWLWPRRKLKFDRLIRWPANLGITMLNTILIRIIFPTAAVGFALQMEAGGLGLVNWLGATGWPVLFASIVLLDLAIWAQHVVFHRVPMLWRLHRMHHTDNDLDVTSGARFHPLEILLSMLIKFAVIGALGAPAVAVMLFEVLLNASSMFNHANVALPGWLDRALRQLIVTPDMHRVHHSIVNEETNANFGFCLSVWDRLFGTYTAQPRAGHSGMTLGLPGRLGMEAQRVDRMLAEPFSSAGEPTQK